jgi:hypothetical protein
MTQDLIKKQEDIKK